MEQRSLMGELLHRRVPQFLGMYVAATWMMVEIGEWMTARFGIPDVVTAYIFVGMIALVPTIVLLAWGHGAPGKDRWTLVQGVLVPLNLILAVVAMIYIVEPGQQPSEPTQTIAVIETREFTDELGETVTYEVARVGFHQRLLTFFWRNETGDPDLDWLSYGAPWLLSEDIQRSPLVSAATPFDSASIIDRLRSTNFAAGVGEPLSLDLQIARSRGLKHIITGEMASVPDGIAMTARVHEVESGDLVGEWTETGPDVLDSIDRLSTAIADSLLQTAQTNSVVTHLSIKEHTSNSLPAIEKMIEALRLRAFDNQYPIAIESIQAALELDPSFAQAHVEAMMMYRYSGDMKQALVQAQNALALDYKLYSELKFAVKATTYALQLQSEKVLQVLEMWRDVHPESLEAHDLLAQNYLVLGSRVEDAQASFKRVLELDPTNQKTLLRIASTHQLLDQADRAIEIIHTYINDHPEDASAHGALGRALIQAGDLASARRAFEEMAFLDTNNPIAELSLAKLLIREGGFEAANQSLSNMLSQDLTDRQRFQVLNQLQSLQARSGQIRLALNTMSEMKVLAVSFLPPILQVFQIGMQRSSYLAQLGEREQALADIEIMRAGLQPPLDGLVLLADINVYMELQEREPFRETHDRLLAFIQEFPFPGIDSVLQGYTALIARWDGDFETSLATYDEMLVSLRRSFISLQEPAVLEQTLLEKAVTLRHAGRLDESTDVLKSLLSMRLAEPRALLELAQVQIQLGQMDQARESLKTLSEFFNNADPDYRYSRELAELVAKVH